MTTTPQEPLPSPTSSRPATRRRSRPPSPTRTPRPNPLRRATASGRERATGRDRAAGESATTPGIDDEDLPEDLQPGEDNPLAEPLEPGETPEVDLNQPSRSYERELEERGESDATSGLRRPNDGRTTRRAASGASADG